MEITTDNSLFEIVQELNLIDAGAKEVAPEDHQRLGEVIRTKVDHCVLFMDDVAARIQRHKDLENEHKAARQHLEKSLDRFGEYVVYTMMQGGFEKLPGDEFVFGTRRSEETILHRDPIPADAEMFPEYVTVKTVYTWNKATVKDHLKSGKFPYDFAAIKINHNLTKGIKK